MAGGRIKGLTVTIDGDTTGLSKALQNVNKEIKSTQQQLKDVDKLSFRRSNACWVMPSVKPKPNWRP